MVAVTQRETGTGYTRPDNIFKWSQEAFLTIILLKTRWLTSSLPLHYGGNITTLTSWSAYGRNKKTTGTVSFKFLKGWSEDVTIHTDTQILNILSLNTRKTWRNKMTKHYRNPRQVVNMLNTGQLLSQKSRQICSLQWLSLTVRG